MNAVQDRPVNLDLVLDVPVTLSAGLGKCEMPLGEVLKLTPGSVVQLDKAATDPIDLVVNGKLIGRGEIVILEQRFGVRICELVNQA